MTKVKHLKPFILGAGFQTDGKWDIHLAHCEQCQQFDPAKPATASRLCLEGAVLYKVDNVVRPRTERPEKPDTYATKAQMKAATRYKGEPT